MLSNMIFELAYKTQARIQSNKSKRSIYIYVYIYYFFPLSIGFHEKFRMRTLAKAIIIIYSFMIMKSITIN